MAVPRCLECTDYWCRKYRSFALLGSKLPPVRAGGPLAKRPQLGFQRTLGAGQGLTGFPLYAHYWADVATFSRNYARWVLTTLSGC
jgi:hypothetical protein